MFTKNCLSICFKFYFVWTRSRISDYRLTYFNFFLEVLESRRVRELLEPVLALQQKVGGQLRWPSDPVLFRQLLNQLLFSGRSRQLAAVNEDAFGGREERHEKFARKFRPKFKVWISNPNSTVFVDTQLDDNSPDAHLYRPILVDR